MGLGILLISISVSLVFAIYIATKLWGSQETQADQMHDTSGAIYYIGPILSNNPNCIYVPNYPTAHLPAHCAPSKGVQGENSVNFEPNKPMNSDLPNISPVEANAKEKECNTTLVEDTSRLYEEKSKGNQRPVQHQTIPPGSASISTPPSEETNATKTERSALRPLIKAHVKGSHDNEALSQRPGDCEDQEQDEQLPSYKQLSINSQSTSHTRLSLKQDNAYLGRQRPDYRPPSTLHNAVDFQGSGSFNPTASSHSPP